MKKGQAIVGVMIGILILIIVGVAVVVPVVSSIITTATTLTSVSLENITFASNNTAYALAHTTDTSGQTPTLYFNSTQVLPTNKYVFTSTTVKIYANGTGTYPNITNGTTTHYYANYDYQGSGYETNSASRTILGFVVLLFVVIIIVAIVGSIGLGKK